MHVALVILSLVAAAAASSNLPTVDLGYEIHQAIDLNTTGGYYNFSNIRYAQPPLGNLRFRAPQAPLHVKDKPTNNGSIGRICPQSNGAWELIAQQFIPYALQGEASAFNYAAALAALEASLQNSSAVPAIDPRTTEDCLFLDVIVPTSAWGEYASSYGGSGLPVLVWIYGGGYTSGEKSVYNPAGLFAASRSASKKGFIFVALNYRLGAFGFLAGPDLQADGTANAGLWDQRLALEWVQKHIHKFGGDKNRVTVMGESAGGGSILHQITAFGGLNGQAPFAQAIPQSPAFVPEPSAVVQEDTYNAFLALLNVSSLAELRALPSEALIAANAAQVAQSPYGTFTYTPVVDGLFAPALPGRLLAQGSFDSNVRVLVGHNADEGLLFTPPFANTTASLALVLEAALPTLPNTSLTYITEMLYPPVYDGSFGYTTPLQRSTVLLSEAVFTCNTIYLDRAYQNDTFAYQYSVPPALHGEDVFYTFYDGPNPSVTNETVAVALQTYITSFVVTGTPADAAAGIPTFPMYGSGDIEINLGVTGITAIMDNISTARCAWWQKGLLA